MVDALTAFEATTGHDHENGAGGQVADNVHYLIHLSEAAGFKIDWGEPLVQSGRALHG